ncbi:MAG: glutamine--fructose-6-phosphate transaminase (isomerizing) [Alphaproteobacteria bacterium]|nr:MAG: glutamine--fructose-6-phosphate transaminase (isomerizing) [Alphaproteobacteria bacterium]
MCGLIAIIHKNEDVYNKIYEGLEFLQYRGYDSCGIVVNVEGKFVINKQVGSIEKLKKDGSIGKIGMGHTRWATHGCINLKNAHPLIKNNIAIVHNGIIENAKEIKDAHDYYDWQTNSDTECILLLIDKFYKEYEDNNGCSSGGVLEEHELLKPLCDSEKKWRYIFEKLFAILEGSFAIALLDLYDSGKIFFARKGLSPLSIAVTDDFASIASDCVSMSAFAEHVIDIQDGQYGHIAIGEYKIYQGKVSEKRCIGKAAKIVKEGYDTWFEYEFYTQPMVLSTALHKLNNTFEWAGTRPNIVDIVGCGSAYLAGCVGKYWIEKYAKILCRHTMASEWAYVPGYESSVVFLSQSGETADTLSVLNKIPSDAKIQKLGFVNTLGSTLARSVDYVVPTFVGQEISVASTKAMTGQMLSLFLWANKLAGIRVHDELIELFDVMSQLIEELPNLTKAVVDICTNVNSLFVLSKGILIPIAQEGALKIKELGYVHAEGFSASELKHGPLAMIDGEKDAAQATIFLAPSTSKLWKKMVSSIEEVQSRGGKIIVFTDKVEEFPNVTCTIKMPHVSEDLCPFLYVLPMQWIAYNIALRKGNSIDMPRNLAKSVTVE